MRRFCLPRYFMMLITFFSCYCVWIWVMLQIFQRYVLLPFSGSKYVRWMNFHVYIETCSCYNLELWTWRQNVPLKCQQYSWHPYCNNTRTKLTSAINYWESLKFLIIVFLYRRKKVISLCKFLNQMFLNWIYNWIFLFWIFYIIVSRYICMVVGLNICCIK
jgi:hypothetical protein